MDPIPPVIRNWKLTPMNSLSNSILLNGNQRWEQRQSTEGIFKDQDLAVILSSQWNLDFMLNKTVSYEKL